MDTESIDSGVGDEKSGVDPNSARGAGLITFDSCAG